MRDKREAPAFTRGVDITLGKFVSQGLRLRHQLALLREHHGRARANAFLNFLAPVVDLENRIELDPLLSFEEKTLITKSLEWTKCHWASTLINAENPDLESDALERAVEDLVLDCELYLKLGRVPS